MKLHPYLNFNGKTEEAFNFYKSIFGGEFTMLQKFKDTPEVGQVSPEDQEKIMHVSLPIGDTILMATDALESMGQHLTVGNNFSISINPDSEAQAKEIYTKLSEGGTIQMPLEKAFWGALFGAVTDKFDIHWMINYEITESK